MYCPECGQANITTARFCTACGAALTAGGLLARTTQNVPSPFAATEPAPVEQMSAQQNTVAMSPLRAGTNWPDVQPTEEGDGTPRYDEPSADSPLSPVADAVVQPGEPQKLYGVAQGAENPFQELPASMPSNEATPGPPVHGTPSFSPTMGDSSAASGNNSAPPLYGISCRVCGTALATNNRQCPRCGTPVGMVVNANDPTANSYLPLGAPPSAGTLAMPLGAVQAAPNNSGQRGPIPAELPTGWNWGAAFATYFWAAAHRVWWYVSLQTLLILALLVVWIGAIATSDNGWAGMGVLISILYAAIWTICRVSFGLHGNRMAWRRRRFDSLNQCIEIQEAWKPAGIAIGVIVLLCMLVVGGFIILGAVFASMAK